MKTRGEYNTKQKEEILSYLKSVKDEAVTVGEIVKYFADGGIKVGTTTIYRHLEKLTEEGLVRRYTLDGSKAAYFELIDEERDCHHPVCYHLKCERCGRLIHLDCDELERAQKHIQEEHGFRLNYRKSILYGLCDRCE